VDAPIGDRSAYVLGRFGRDEGPTVAKMISRAADAIECWLRDGVTAAMNQYNGDVDESTDRD